LKTILIGGGAFHLGFALFHACFWKLFRWKASLRRAAPIDRAVIQVMNLCLIYLFMFIAFASFFRQDWLAANKIFLVFISGFWIFRTVLQFLFFDWKKPFSVILTVLFLFGAMLYLFAAVRH
jgi:hypothetical protein